MKFLKPSSPIAVLFLSCVLTCWVGGVIYAQSTQLHFRHFTTEDGLPSSETYTVFEDDSGYMWFGTDNGVARFDGYSFEVFDTNDGLDDVVVFTILADDTGRIWAGTYSGDLYYFEHGRFYPYAYNNVVQKARKNNEFIHLVDVRGTEDVVIRLQRSGLQQIDRNGEINPLRVGSVFGLSLYAPDCSGPGSLLISPIARSFPKRLTDIVDKKIMDLPIYLGNEACSRKIGQVKIKVNKEPLWPIRNVIVVTENDGEKVLFFTPATLTVSSKKVAEPKKYALNSSTNYVLPISAYSFWFGKEHGGGLELITFNEENEIVEQDTFLLGRSVSFIQKDANDGLWVTTTDAGVFYCPFPAQRKYLIGAGAKPLSIAPTGDGGFYAGYTDGALYQYDGKNERSVALEVPGPFGGRHEFVMFDTISNTLFSSHVMVEHEPMVISGKRNRDFLHYYSVEKESFRRLDLMTTGDQLGPRKGLCSNSIRFGILDLDTREIDFISQSNKYYYGVQAFLVDSLNRYLLGTLNGLMAFKPDLQDTLPLRIDLGAEELTTRIVKIVEHQGGLLFGTRGEGMVFLQNGEKIVIKEQDGLASDMVRDFEVADDGNIWVATLTGLSKVEYNDQGATIRTFREEDGLISKEVLDAAVYGEEVWLATSAGVQKFEEPPPVCHSPPPIIRSFTVDTTVSNGQGAVDIGPGDHNIEIEFGSINFRLGDNILYRYRLGVNDPWRYTNDRTVTFPRLGPGAFAFSVASQNEAGEWSTSTKVIFIIATPWYATWWIRGSSFLLVMASTVWFFLRRERNRKRENDFLLKISQLEHEALHAQMNPHFVFNTLNSIQNFVLHNDAKQAATYLSRFALVVRQTLNSSVKGWHTLAQEIEMLETYLTLEKLRFKEGFQYEINKPENLPLEAVALPPLLIQPFVENAILHGLKEVHEGGLIRISFSGNAQRLEVEIIDNGTGYELNDHHSEESLGMAITRRRLAMMKGRHKNASGMSVETIYNTEGLVGGTRVQLWIYLEQRAINEMPKALD